MRVKFTCENPECRVSWSAGVHVEKNPDGSERCVKFAVVIAILDGRIRIPVECPACGVTA